MTDESTEGGLPWRPGQGGNHPLADRIIEYLIAVAALGPHTTPAEASAANVMAYQLALRCTQEEWAFVVELVININGIGKPVATLCTLTGIPRDLAIWHTPGDKHGRRRR